MGKCKIKAIQTDLGTFRYNQENRGIIQIQSSIFRTLCNPSIFITVVYPEPRHIENQKHIQNPGIFATLVYSEPRYIQSAGIFTIRGIFCTLSSIYVLRKQLTPIVSFVNYNYCLSISLLRSLLHEMDMRQLLPQRQLVIPCKKLERARGTRTLNF